MTVAGRFAAALDDIFPDSQPRRLALAVSGGGDSMALMHLAADWASHREVALQVVTVDHRLRPEAEREAETVAEAASALGLPHTTLRWGGWDGQGNLQDAARRARRELIEAWARPFAPNAILTGHTMDDQAETLVMRLARGSGVDGLAGMALVRRWREVWARPLLGIRRAELREWLIEKGESWLEDPTNEDPRFDRVRARRMLRTLAELGLTVERLDATAKHMRLARDVLEAAAGDLAERAVTTQVGDVLVGLVPFRQAALETRTRLLAAALQWVSGAAYRPRYSAIERLSAEPVGALHGCLLTGENGTLRVTRELAAVRDLSGPTDAVWDGRWRLEGPHAPDLRAAALTRQGLAQCPNWRESGLPAVSLQASPAVWRGSELVAAPVAGMENGWSATLIPGRDVFSIQPIMR